VVDTRQQSYIENLLVRFGLQDAQTVTTPLAPGTILTKDQCPSTPDEINDMAGNRYRELIGSLHYASLATRPDITYAVNKLSQFLANPGRAHLDAALRVLRYLKGTAQLSLHLGGGIPDVAGFADSRLTRETDCSSDPTSGVATRNLMWNQIQQSPSLAALLRH